MNENLQRTAASVYLLSIEKHNFLNTFKIYEDAAEYSHGLLQCTYGDSISRSEVMQICAGKRVGMLGA